MIVLATVELIVLATVESSAMIFLQQPLSIAAYKGARVALVPDSEEENVCCQAELILNSREVQGASVVVTPSNFDSSPEGTWIQVVANAPFADDSLAGGWLFNGHNLSTTVEMVKEH